MDRDKLFRDFVIGIFIILLLYGVAMVVLTLVEDDTIAIKLISGFGNMFGALLGLGTGYLLGRQNGGDKEGQ